jgi:hypothetical protein
MVARPSGKNPPADVLSLPFPWPRQLVFAGAILIRARRVGASPAGMGSGAAADPRRRADRSGRALNVMAITEKPIDAPARRAP